MVVLPVPSLITVKWWAVSVRGDSVVSIAAGKKLMDSVKLWSLAENLGSIESLITHPVTMTHADVDEAERKRVGISDGLVRISVGLEDAEDLIAALDAALAQI